MTVTVSEVVRIGLGTLGAAVLAYVTHITRVRELQSELKYFRDAYVQAKKELEETGVMLNSLREDIRDNIPPLIDRVFTFTWKDARRATVEFKAAGHMIQGGKHVLLDRDRYLVAAIDAEETLYVESNRTKSEPAAADPITPLIRKLQIKITERIRVLRAFESGDTALAVAELTRLNEIIEKGNETANT